MTVSTGLLHFHQFSMEFRGQEKGLGSSRDRARHASKETPLATKTLCKFKLKNLITNLICDEFDSLIIHPLLNDFPRDDRLTARLPKIAKTNPTSTSTRELSKFPPSSNHELIYHNTINPHPSCHPNATSPPLRSAHRTQAMCAA